MYVMNARTMAMTEYSISALDVVEHEGKVWFVAADKTHPTRLLPCQLPKRRLCAQQKNYPKCKPEKQPTQAGNLNGN